MKNNTKAFTFVELIIVLVILAILSAIGFVVYESYLSTGRDTKRIVELKNLHQSLGSFAIKNKLPLPSDKIDITSSGNLITYHGNIDDSIGKTINFKGKLHDKELENYPTYVLGKNRKDFQLLNFVEDRSSLLEGSISTSYAFTDYQILTPTAVGKPLGVFLEGESKEPIQISEKYKGGETYDIISGTGVFDIYMSKDKVLSTSQTGAIFQILPNYSCKRILEMGKSKGNGEYTLSVNGVNKIKAYCDMRIDGGGWTMVLNYLHKGGTNPDLDTLVNILPLKSNMGLGVDESNSKYWGHISTEFLSEFDFSEILFYGVTNEHNRVINFKTVACNEYFKSGNGGCQGINTNHTLLNGHTSRIPQIADRYFEDRRNYAMTYIPFYVYGTSHWSMKGNSGYRWEVDSNSGNANYDTHHQIYIR